MRETRFFNGNRNPSVYNWYRIRSFTFSHPNRISYFRNSYFTDRPAVRVAITIITAFLRPLPENYSASHEIREHIDEVMQKDFNILAYDTVRCVEKQGCDRYGHFLPVQMIFLSIQLVLCLYHSVSTVHGVMKFNQLSLTN